MILLRLILFCALFTLCVRLSVLGGAADALYFYPKEYQKTAFARGLADPARTAAKRKRFMIPFLLVMTAALLAIVCVWNRPRDFRGAYLQSLLFLEVMNWYDGIVIDEVWVRFSPFWKIAGMEGVPYVRSLREMVRKRAIGSAVFAALALLPALLCTAIRI